MKKEWEAKKLIEVCEKITDGSHFSPKSSNEGAYPYITVRDICGDQINFNNCKFIDEDNYKSLSKNGCRPVMGDILFSKDGTVGKVSLVDVDKDFVVLSSLAIIRPRQEIINPIFLKYILQSPMFLQEAIGKKTGVAIRRIVLKNLKLIDISYPCSLAEQQRIVSILDESFDAIAKAKENAERNLHNARELFESYLQNVFANPGDDWEEKKLGKVCDFIRGPFGGSLKKEIFVDDGYAVYEQAHAIYNQFKNIRYYITEAKFIEMKRFELKPGNLIMSCSGTMGKVAIVPDGIKKGIINQALLTLIPNERIINKFIKYWMESENFQDRLKSYSAGAAIQNVASVKVLKEIQVPIPTLEKQHRIISGLDSLLKESKKLEAIYEQKLDDLEELKKSVLKKAFNGEL